MAPIRAGASRDVSEYFGAQHLASRWVADLDAELADAELADADLTAGPVRSPERHRVPFRERDAT